MLMPRLVVCGAINWDITLFVDKLPKPGEEVKVNRIISVPGGKGANTAVAAARILGRDDVGIIGMVGVDEIGDRQITILHEAGVDTSCVIRHKQLLSGQAYVVVDSAGENMILTHRAANQAMTVELSRSSHIDASIDKSRMMIVIDPPIDTAKEIVAQAYARNKAIIFSPATLVNQGFSDLQSLLQYANYLILNEHEAIALSGVGDGPSACEKISSRLGGKKVITTLGADGCIISEKGSNKVIPSVDLLLLGLKVVSTVGAGDAFEGAFASFKLMGLGDLESVFLANVAAAIKITREQTRGSPTYEEIKKYAESDDLRTSYDKFRFT